MIPLLVTTSVRARGAQPGPTEVHTGGYTALQLLKIDVPGKYDVQLESRNLQRHFCRK